MAFSDFTKKISDGAKSANQKLKDAAQVSKLESSVKQEEAKISAAITGIGQKYADTHESSYDPEFAGFFEAITAAREAIASLKEQIIVIKGLIKCAGCGADISVDTTFCPNCGTKNEFQPPADTAETLDPNTPRCANCGAPLAPGTLFCSECGTRVEA